MSVIRRLRARLGAHGDRGGVAVTVGLLLGSGVLLGMAALVVDVGNLYAERGQLQNGADAGAVRVAHTCATDPAGCSSPAVADLQGVADRYADENANDGAADVTTVCGRGGDLPQCPPWQDSLADCVGPPPESVSYVEVHTSTRTDDDSTALPPVFAHAVVGGFEGAKVRACSRVAWGPPVRATTLAMTISACDWQRGTDDGTAYEEVEQVVPVYDDSDPNRCTAGGSTGGFRWLGDRAPECRASVSVEVGYPIAPGNSGTPNDCEDALARLRESKRPALVPVFDEVVGNEGNAKYTPWGFAAFVVTGWHLPGSDQPSATRTSCGGGKDFCVYGYFTQTVVPGGGAIGGPDLGARVVAPIG